MARLRTLIGCTVSALALVTAAHGAIAADKPETAKSAAKHWSPPKTPWGDPDLQGTWPLDGLGRTPLQRPAQYGDRLYLSDDEYKKALASAAEANKGAEKEEH